MKTELIYGDIFNNPNEEFLTVLIDEYKKHKVEKIIKAQITRSVRKLLKKARNNKKK